MPDRSDGAPMYAAEDGKARKAGKTEKKARKRSRDLAVKGRVLVRDTVTRQGWSNEILLSNARLGVKYRDRKHGVQAELEAELAERRAEVRDAYLRVRAGKGIRVQAGRFKRPISAISLASRWELPTIERGALNDFRLNNERTREPDELPFGREIGVQMQIRSKGLPAEPALTIGVFRSAVHAQIAQSSGGSRLPLDLTEQFPEDVFGRLELEPLPWMRAGASLAWVGQLRVAGASDSFRHGLISGLDLVIDRAPLRLWLEGFIGQSAFHVSNDLQARGRFVAGRAIVAARLPVQSFYVEPYVTAQHFDLRSDLDEDDILQAGGGVNLGLGEVWKLQLAVDYLSVGNRLYGDATQFHAQLGAAF
jgi:hypothetical protein